MTQPGTSKAWTIPRLAELAALRADWDSYGAEPITPQALATVDNLSICPTGESGIVVEFTDPNGSVVNVTIGPFGKIESVYICDRLNKIELEVER